MGMYDYLRCEYALPEKEAQNELFQTKDFGCTMDTFTITKKGELLHDEWHYKPVKGAKGFVGSITRKIDKKNVKVPFHGIITFYTALNNDYENPESWHEYEAKFTDGKLKSIKRVPN